MSPIEIAKFRNRIRRSEESEALAPNSLDMKRIHSSNFELESELEFESHSQVEMESETLNKSKLHCRRTSVLSSSSSSSSSSPTSSTPPRRICNLVLFSLLLLNYLKIVQTTPQPVPQDTENLELKIRMFLESHCSMQNQTLEQEEFESFMNCGPSHGAGIVKSLKSIPEYKSEDFQEWTRGSRKVILTECQMWPQDRKCQEVTFSLIEKCFEKDQKFIFYFNFALTDIICQTGTELFVRFWQGGGDECLISQLRSLKKDFSDCLEKTNTHTNLDVYRNFDTVMQCFRTQFSKDCNGSDVELVLDEIMAEIRRVYYDTSSGAHSTTLVSHISSFPLILLAGLVTFM